MNPKFVSFTMGAGSSVYSTDNTPRLSDTKISGLAASSRMKSFGEKPALFAQAEVLDDHPELKKIAKGLGDGYEDGMAGKPGSLSERELKKITPEVAKTLGVISSPAPNVPDRPFSAKAPRPK